MPSLKVFQTKVVKRGCPIKALLLDQSFSAGIGNWIAGWPLSVSAPKANRYLIDEVLFHSAIHPEHVAKYLSPEQVASLHHNIVYVCQTAVDVNADHHKFPSHWLFPHRWVRLPQFFPQ
jgi:formamidopyrimidine-DNA glycosylase